MLQVNLILSEADSNYSEQKIALILKSDKEEADAWLFETVRLTWEIKLFTKFELELLTRLREMADEEAIKVFSNNLRDLLLSAPAGAKITIGLDPGIRTGVKVVVIDQLVSYLIIPLFFLSHLKMNGINP